MDIFQGGPPGSVRAFPQYISTQLAEHIFTELCMTHTCTHTSFVGYPTAERLSTVVSEAWRIERVIMYVSDVQYSRRWTARLENQGDREHTYCTETLGAYINTVQNLYFGKHQPGLQRHYYSNGKNKVCRQGTCKACGWLCHTHDHTMQETSHDT